MKKLLLLTLLLLSACGRKEIRVVQDVELRQRVARLESMLSETEIPLFDADELQELHNKDSEFLNQIGLLQAKIDTLESEVDSKLNQIQLQVSKIMLLETRLARIEFLIKHKLVTKKELEKLLEDL